MADTYNPRTGAKNALTHKWVTATFTRPANTTAYAAGDIVNDSTSAPTVLTLANAGRRKGGTGKIVQVILECNLATVTNGDFRIYFFNDDFTPDNDNAAFTLLHANADALMGWVDMDTLTADGASAAAASSRAAAAGYGGADDGLPVYFECASDDDNLYAVVVAQGAYTPSSAEVFRVSILVEHDA